MNHSHLWRILPLLVLTSAAHAQFTVGSIYAAPGGQTIIGGHTTAWYAFGGSFERIVSHTNDAGVESSTLGAGAGLSGIIPSHGEAGNTIGTLDLNFYVHGRNRARDSKFDPFLTPGYTFFFGGNYRTTGLNAGLGMHYWYGEKHGLLVEAVDQVALGRGGAIHFWQFRVGLSFR
jgi:hypothetical protein